MKVIELIHELAMLDPDMEVVIPGAPYDQPRLVDYLGVVILDEDDEDTGLSKGEYIGIGMGVALDDDTIDESNEEELLEKLLLNPDAEFKNYDPIEADSIEEFQEKLFNQLFNTTDDKD
jgi:hypothetical protein